MDISSAIPLGIGAASAALGSAKSMATGVFSLIAGQSSTTEDIRQTSEASPLAALFASAGTLNADADQLQEELEKSLDALRDLLRDAMHRSGENLPDSFQLRITSDGQLDGSLDRFSQQARSLLQESQEADRLLTRIAAQTAAIEAATRKERFAQQYNQDPAAALAAAEEQKSARPGVDVAYVDGKAVSYQIVST